MGISRSLRIMWPKLVEGFLSNLARTLLRHIQAASKQELKIASWPLSMTSAGSVPDMIRMSEMLH